MIKAVDLRVLHDVTEPPATHVPPQNIEAEAILQELLGEVLTEGQAA